MRYRSFKRISTGQRLQALFTADDRFSVPASVHAQQVGDIFGFSDVEAEDTAVPPDLTGAVPSPVPPPPPGPSDEDVQRELETNRLIKSVVIWVAQRAQIPLAQARDQIVAIYRGL